MSFSNYLSNVNSVIGHLITLLGSVLSNLMNNHIFKTILFIAIIYFIIDNFEKLLDFVLNIFSRKVSSDKQKQNSNSDIE